MTHVTSVDPNFGMRPLKLQSGLRSSEKPLRFGIAHDPLAPLLLPSRTGTYFAPKIDQYRVPDEFEEWMARRCILLQSIGNPTTLANYDAILASG